MSKKVCIINYLYIKIKKKNKNNKLHPKENIKPKKYVKCIMFGECYEKKNIICEKRKEKSSIKMTSYYNENKCKYVLQRNGFFNCNQIFRNIFYVKLILLYVSINLSQPENHCEKCRIYSFGLLLSQSKADIL